MHLISNDSAGMRLAPVGRRNSAWARIFSLAPDRQSLKGHLAREETITGVVPCEAPRHQQSTRKGDEPMVARDHDRVRLVRTSDAQPCGGSRDRCVLITGNRTGGRF